MLDISTQTGLGRIILLAWSEESDVVGSHMACHQTTRSAHTLPSGYPDNNKK
jgi:hypothetical protein